MVTEKLMHDFSYQMITNKLLVRDKVQKIHSSMCLTAYVAQIMGIYHIFLYLLLLPLSSARFQMILFHHST